MRGSPRVSTMIGAQMTSLKRKEPDDLVQDLLNVSLSPNKKLRASDPALSSFTGVESHLASSPTSDTQWGFSPVTPSVGSTPLSTSVTPTPLSASLPRQPAAQEQKALVLYRPVTPPLFPGGPPLGSVDYPYKVNSAMLHIPQGTDRELTSQLDCQSAFSNDKDTPSGHGLFQALDLSGGPMPYHGLRRLNRISSCSSLPRFSVNMEDQVMVEEIDKSADMAVIPWVPMTPIVVPSKSRPIIEEVDDEPGEASEVDEMGEVESMEVVNEEDIIIADTNTTPEVNQFESSKVGQFGSPLPSFSADPWQAEILQPPFTQAMWS